MTILADESHTLLDCLAPVFTRPTFQRFLLLLDSVVASVSN